MRTRAARVKAVFEPIARLSTEGDVINQPDLFKSFLDNYLVQHDYHRARACFDLLRELKGGETRDDGKTLAIYHEMSQESYAIFCDAAGFPMPDMERFLSMVFLHDLGEDYGQTPGDIENYLNKKLGSSPDHAVIANDMWILTKKYDGIYRFPSEEAYLANTLANPGTAIGKMGDHAHNMATAPVVLDKDRLERAYHETIQLYGPFIDRARALYPDYADVINRYGWLLSRQMAMIAPLVTGKRQTRSMASEFNFKSGFYAADRYFPTGLGPLAMPQKRIEKNGLAPHANGG